ncbi:TRAP transporter small permease [Hoeflea sp.]|uniref:TRAP transporter small permease n=1 Tax=Hoeflea sp. TaxID=1940281 RepID=UPI00198793E2|nr:TRAP transporter small permease [Hoeflea sp.]MBC7285677.1 TRAP transporter small permease [Hoeflea sp.]
MADVLLAFVIAVNRVFAAVASLLILAVALLVFWDVVARYAFDAPSLWISDFAKFSLTYIFFLGLAPALQSGHHVSVDLFDGLWPDFLKPLMPRLALIACIVFGCVLLWFLAKLTLRTFDRNPLAQTILPVRLKYIHVVGPVGAAQFVLTSLALLLRPAGSAERV